jgi:hypothetical protein
MNINYGSVVAVVFGIALIIIGLIEITRESIYGSLLIGAGLIMLAISLLHHAGTKALK